MNWEIRRYEPTLEKYWNELNALSLNGNFLFDRSFMDYHHDRFADHSVIIFRNSRPIALFPANQKNTCLFSHEGLSYGGFVWLEKLNTQTAFEMYFFLEKYFSENGISKIFYKKMPFFYRKSNSRKNTQSLEEIIFWYKKNPLILRRLGAAIPLENIRTQGTRIFQKRRLRQWKKAIQHGLVFSESLDYQSFWEKILVPNLQQRASLKPTHTLREIELLARRFPNHIKLFVAHQNSELLGGTVIFENRQIAHAQYIAANEKGKKLGALDLVFGKLITEEYIDFQHFSLGTSDDEKGINWGIWEWKESWGAELAYYDTYEISPQKG